jgi:hypothetical protein
MMNLTTFSLIFEAHPHVLFARSKIFSEQPPTVLHHPI